MRPPQESQLKKVGILAGTGRSPELLAERLEAEGKTPYIVAFSGITDPSLYRERQHLVAPIGMAGRILSWLKEQGVSDVVMTGALKRPEWSKLKVDPRGMMIIAKVALKKLGDDSLLRVLRKEIEAEGLTLRGIQDFVPELLAGEGVLGLVQPLPEDEDTIQRGFNAAKELGRQDQGQSVVVQQDSVLGLEDAGGTKALMEKAAKDKSVGRGPILVKVCKPQQDRALDMPTIGVQTVETAREGGFAGIVVEAGETLILDSAEVVRLCNNYGLFLLGRRA